MKKVTILGAGLAGSLLAIYLAKRDYEVFVYDARPDPRKTTVDTGRSINLALSCRGMTGLVGVDMLTTTKPFMAPMRGRAIHEARGIVNYQPFGRHNDEYINAIARADLNKILLAKAESYPKVHLAFESTVTTIDLYKKTIELSLSKGEKVFKNYEYLIGADGATSVLRESLIKENLVKASRVFLPYGYKELSISSSASSKFAPENLHLWPRDSFLLLGNPNCDNSITGSLFLAKEGKNSFADLSSEISIKSFFKKSFPDAFESMPNLVEEFMNHPTGNMSTIKCSPWYYKSECLLIGDAAHGVVPFFGQGMNCAFEDCRIFASLLDEYSDDWTKVLPLFYKARKPNTDAVARMSLENYKEIQVSICDSRFNLKKQLELYLMNHYPETYISKHVLVMFTNTPYAIADKIGLIQKKLLRELCKGVKTINEIDNHALTKFIKNYDEILAQTL